MISIVVTKMDTPKSEICWESGTQAFHCVYSQSQSGLLAVSFHFLGVSAQDFSPGPERNALEMKVAIL